MALCDCLLNLGKSSDEPIWVMAVETHEGRTMLVPKGVEFAVKARPVEVDNPELVVILTPSPGEGGTNEPQKRKRTTNENQKVKRVVQKVKEKTKETKEPKSEEADDGADAEEEEKDDGADEE